MKKLIFVFVLAMITSFTVEAQRVAYIDMQSIMEKIPDYKRAQDQLESISNQWRQEIAREYDQIKSMYSKYQAEQVLLSESARQKREDEIVAKEKAVRDKQRAKFGPEGALFKKRQELIKPVQDKVYNAIEEYAGDRGYDFIFDKNSSEGMIFANPRYDKTADVMKKLGIE